MLPFEYELIQPGTRLLVGDRLLGGELYGADDPENCEEYLGQVVTAKKIFEDTHNKTWLIDIEENSHVTFFIEEIEGIADVCQNEEMEELDIESILSFS